MKRPVLRPLAALLLAACSGASQALDVKGLDGPAAACTDFYQFANRKWLQATEIPADRTFWGAASIIARANEDMLIGILDEAAKQKNQPPSGSPQRKVIEYYARGMDEAGIRDSELKPLAPFLGSIASLKEREAMARLLGDLHTRGIFPGFAFEVEYDRRIAGRYVAEIRQGGLGLPDRDYYFLEDERSKQIRAAYRDHIARVLKVNGDDDAQAAANAAAIIELETELARVSMTAVEKRDLEKSASSAWSAARTWRASWASCTRRTSSPASRST